MSDSEKELEKRVLEAGENLLDQPPPSSIRRLLELLDLDEVFCCLSKVEQNPPSSMKNALSPSIKALAAAQLFKHSDVDVKVSVAACITQIMRITAPNAPYDDEKMKEVFQLIVSSFEHLSDMCSCSYAKRISILETVSKLKFVTVMLNLECDALVIQMFQRFLNVIRDHHPMEVFLYMENIMTHALEERDDIPPEMLSPILHYVKKDHKVPQVSRRLAEHILTNCASKLKTYLTEAVKSSGVSLDKYSNVVASICEGTFSASKQNRVVVKSVQDLTSKKTSVEENECAAEEGHREESRPTKAVKWKKKEISTKKTIPSATASATKATSEEINTTTEAKLTKKIGKVPSSNTAKPTLPPTKKKASEKKEVEMVWCKKPRSQRRKKKSQDVGEPRMRSHYQLLREDNKKASDLQNYDEKLVGLRIRVWWPIDEMYYKGVVCSYNSSRKRHLVCYDDGDQEILNLKKQKWYFVDESESSKDREGNQTGRDEEASTMPQKKKAKTCKSQSANKQSKMISPIPPYVRKDDEVPQVSFAEQVLSRCASHLKTHLTDAVKSSSVSIDKHSNVEDSTCDRAFDALKQEKEDRQGPREATVKDNQKPAEVSTPKQSCVDTTISSINKNRHESVSIRRGAVIGVKTQEKRTHEMVQLPVEEDDPAETETRTHKRPRVESCSLHEPHDKMGKTTAAEGEHSCVNHKSSVVPKDLQHKRVLQPCFVPDQMAKVKQSIVDSITLLRQFRSELETKEENIVEEEDPAEAEIGKKRTHEMVQLLVAKEEDPAEAEIGTHKRARVESCRLHEEMEKTTAAEGEPSCRNHKSSAEPEHKKLPQPCSVSDQLAKVKQSIVDTITSVRQFGSELETKEQSIVDILTSVRQFRSEIKKKEDNLEASLQEVDVLGEKKMGINKILNS